MLKEVTRHFGAADLVSPNSWPLSVLIERSAKLHVLGEYETIIYSTARGTHRVSLNRPKVLNAINSKMLSELSDAVGRIRRNASSRVVILGGEGGNFSAGADLKEGATRSSSVARREQSTDYLISAIETFNALETLPLPTIASVSGYCLGGGAELMMRCDIRVASDDSKFGFPEIKSGVFPSFGGTRLLPRHVGLGNAKRLMMTGDIIDAKSALSMGLVDYVVTPAKRSETVESLASNFAGQAPLALMHLKRLLSESLETPAHASTGVEILSAFKNASSADAVEGFRAFAEKRKPRYQGK